MLEEVADAYAPARQLEELRREGASAWLRRGALAARRPEESSQTCQRTQWIARRVVDECDALHGGFGTDGKFLHVAALRVALGEYARTRDARTRASADADPGCDGGRADSRCRRGGFFRYAASRDWTRPHTEKMLDDQVGLVELYRGRGRDRWRAHAIVESRR